SFQGLQHRGSHPKHQIVFYAFDVLHLDGQDLMNRRLIERRDKLPEVVGQHSRLRISQSLPGSAANVVEAGPSVVLDGVIAKRKDSIYQPGERSGDWGKLEREEREAICIGGI